MVTELGLTGKRVVVTGAAGGLGRAFARAFAEAGAVVLAADINGEGAAETAAMLGGTVSAAAVDVTDTASTDALAALAAQRMGGTDVLVNNAALYGGLQRRRFEEIDADVWDAVMRVNIKGVWQMCRAFSPSLRTSGAGSIQKRPISIQG